MDDIQRKKKRARNEVEEERKTHDDTVPSIPELDIRKPGQNSDVDDIETRSKIIKEALSKLTEDEMTRFEFFTRSHFNHKDIKQIMIEASGWRSKNGEAPITEPMAIVVGALAKLFVGDLVETAKQIMQENNESGALTEDHLLAAFAHLQANGSISTSSDPCAFTQASYRPAASQPNTQDDIQL